MAEFDPAETVLARGWRDTVKRVHTFWFWFLEFVVAGAIGAITQNPWASIIVVVAVLAAFWIYATVAAPFRQRNEARNLLREHARQALSPEAFQRARIDDIWPALSEAQITMIRGMEHGARPTGDDSVKQSLVDLGLIDRDFTGFTTLKDEFRAHVAQKLRGDQQNQFAPDMPIRDLFFHIDKDCLETISDENRWELIGRDIRDRLSTGQLRSWGRIERAGSPPLMPIDAAYWAAADWSYWFFQEKGESQNVDVYTESSNGPNYKDVRVNKAEALQIWPAPGPADTDKPDRKLDPEIEAIMRNVGRLKDICLTFVPKKQIRDEFVERYQKLEKSDHLLWQDKPARHMRLDFLNSCGFYFTDAVRSIAEQREIQAEVKERAELLLSELKTLGSK